MNRLLRASRVIQCGHSLRARSEKFKGGDVLMRKSRVREGISDTQSLVLQYICLQICLRICLDKTRVSSPREAVVTINHFLCRLSHRCHSFDTSPGPTHAGGHEGSKINT